MTMRPPAVRRWHPPRLAALAALAALPLGGCGDAAAPRPPLEGQWVAAGSPELGVSGTTIELALTQEGDDVRGEGSFVQPGGFAAPLAVDGVYAGGIVQLVLASPTLPRPLVYNALLGGDRASMTGTLDAGPGTGVTRTFTRTR